MSWQEDVYSARRLLCPEWESARPLACRECTCVLCPGVLGRPQAAVISVAGCIMPRSLDHLAAGRLQDAAHILRQGCTEARARQPRGLACMHMTAGRRRQCPRLIVPPCSACPLQRPGLPAACAACCPQAAASRSGGRGDCGRDAASLEPPGGLCASPGLCCPVHAPGPTQAPLRSQQPATLWASLPGCMWQAHGSGCQVLQCRSETQLLSGPATQGVVS